MLYLFQSMVSYEMSTVHFAKRCSGSILYPLGDRAEGVTGLRVWQSWSRAYGLGESHQCSAGEQSGYPQTLLCLVSVLACPVERSKDLVSNILTTYLSINESSFLLIISSNVSKHSSIQTPTINQHSLVNYMMLYVSDILRLSYQQYKNRTTHLNTLY